MSNSVMVFVCRMHPDATVPEYQTKDSSGMDLHAIEDGVVPARGRRLFDTGIGLDISPGYEGQVRPRSGMSLRDGVVAAFGTIDADYRGSVGATLYNFTDDEFVVTKGMRIAQLVIAPVVRAELYEVKELKPTARGAGGFGSTGR